MKLKSLNVVSFLFGCIVTASLITIMANLPVQSGGSGQERVESSILL